MQSGLISGRERSLVRRDATLLDRQTKQVFNFRKLFKYALHTYALCYDSSSINRLTSDFWLVSHKLKWCLRTIFEKWRTKESSSPFKFPHLIRRTIGTSHMGSKGRSLDGSHWLACKKDGKRVLWGNSVQRAKRFTTWKLPWDTHQDHICSPKTKSTTQVTAEHRDRFSWAHI